MSKNVEELAEKVKSLSPAGKELVKNVLGGGLIEGDDLGVVLSLDELIKATVKNMDTIKVEIKKLNEQVKDACQNDALYKEDDDKVKAAQKKRMATKHVIMQQPAMQTLANKLKTLRAELKDKQFSLSDYLLEYQRLTQANQLELPFGEVLEIVNTAKVVRKAAGK